MIKKNLNTTHTHTHKHIWCIFLEMNKWGTRERKKNRNWKTHTHTHTHMCFIYLEISNWVYKRMTLFL